MKVLNLYAGIGGNRKLWDDVEVTAVEIDPKIAAIYQDFFPDDNVVIGDAHQYLLDHYKEFDFIWSSPPCPTHSRARFWSGKGGIVEPKYPEMKLYQEIILLENWYEGLYCVENTISYYDPLIRPKVIGKHYLWSNFMIRDYKTNENSHHFGTYKEMEDYKGFSLEAYGGIDKKTILRNCVHPDFGKHVLDCARGNTQLSLSDFHTKLSLCAEEKE